MPAHDYDHWLNNNQYNPPKSKYHSYITPGYVNSMKFHSIDIASLAKFNVQPQPHTTTNNQHQWENESEDLLPLHFNFKY